MQQQIARYSDTMDTISPSKQRSIAQVEKPLQYANNVVEQNTKQDTQIETIMQKIDRITQIRERKQQQKMTNSYENIYKNTKQTTPPKKLERVSSIPKTVVTLPPSTSMDFAPKNIAKTTIAPATVQTKEQAPPELIGNSQLLRSIASFGQQEKNVVLSNFEKQKRVFELDDDILKTMTKKMELVNTGVKTENILSQSRLPDTIEDTRDAYSRIMKNEQSINMDDITIKPEDTRNINLMSSIKNSVDRNNVAQSQIKGQLVSLHKRKTQIEDSVKDNVQNIDMYTNTLSTVVKATDAVNIASIFNAGVGNIEPKNEIRNTINDVGAEHNKQIQNIISDVFKSNTIANDTSVEMKEKTDILNALRRDTESVMKQKNETGIKNDKIKQQNREFAEQLKLHFDQLKNESNVAKNTQRVSLNNELVNTTDLDRKSSIEQSIKKLNTEMTQVLPTEGQLKQQLTDQEKVDIFLGQQTKQSQALEVETNALKKHVQVLQDQIQKLKKVDENALDKTTMMAEKTILAQKQMQNAYKSNISRMSSRIQSLVKDSDKITIENTELRAQLDHMDKLHKIQDIELKDKNTKVSKLTEDMKAVNRTLESSQPNDASEKMESDLNSQKITLFREQQLSNSLRTKLNEQNVEIDVLKSQISKTEEYKNTVDQLQNDIEKITKENTRSQKDASDALRDHSVRLSQLQKKMEETKGTNETLIKEVNQCREGFTSKTRKLFGF